MKDPSEKPEFAYALLHTFPSSERSQEGSFYTRQLSNSPTAQHVGDIMSVISVGYIVAGMDDMLSQGLTVLTKCQT